MDASREGLGVRVPEREWGGCCIMWGGACCLAERGSKAYGSKYLPRSTKRRGHSVWQRWCSSSSPLWAKVVGLFRLGVAATEYCGVLIWTEPQRNHAEGSDDLQDRRGQMMCTKFCGVSECSSAGGDSTKRARHNIFGVRAVRTIICHRGVLFFFGGRR